MENAAHLPEDRPWATYPGWVAVGLAVAIAVPVLSLAVVVPGLVCATRARHVGAIAGFGLAVAIAVVVATIRVLFEVAVDPV